MYEELSIERLKIELSMLNQWISLIPSDEANIYMMEQPLEIKKIFPGIIELINLLLVCLFSSVSFEHGFSKVRII